MDTPLLQQSWTHPYITIDTPYFQSWAQPYYSHGHTPITVMGTPLLQSWTHPYYSHGHTPIVTVKFCNKMTNEMGTPTSDYLCCSWKDRPLWLISRREFTSRVGLPSLCTPAHFMIDVPPTEPKLYPDRQQLKADKDRSECWISVY